MENIVYDAHSRMHSREMVMMAILAISFDLLSEIQFSWEVDEELKNVIIPLQ